MSNLIPFGDFMVDPVDVVRWGWTDYESYMSGASTMELSKASIWLRSAPLHPLQSRKVDVRNIDKVRAINAKMRELFPHAVGASEVRGWCLDDLLRWNQ